MQKTIIKIRIFLYVFTFLVCITAVKAETIKKDCSIVKNLYKKMTCMANNATSGLSSKKSLQDYLPEDVFKKEKNDCSMEIQN